MLAPDFGVCAGVKFENTTWEHVSLLESSGLRRVTRQRKLDHHRIHRYACHRLCPLGIIHTGRSKKSPHLLRMIHALVLIDFCLVVSTLALVIQTVQTVSKVHTC